MGLIDKDFMRRRRRSSREKRPPTAWFFTESHKWPRIASARWRSIRMGIFGYILGRPQERNLEQLSFGPFGCGFRDCQCFFATL